MPSDEIAIQDIVNRFEVAWNRADGEGIAGLCAADATFIQVFGGKADGRKAIEASHRQLFDTVYRESRIRFAVQCIRLVRRDVAIVFARCRLKVHQAGKTRDLETRPTLTLVKERAKWRIVAYQNTRISQAPASTQAAAGMAS